VLPSAKQDLLRLVDPFDIEREDSLIFGFTVRTEIHTPHGLPSYGAPNALRVHQGHARAPGPFPGRIVAACGWGRVLSSPGYTPPLHQRQRVGTADPCNKSLDALSAGSL
jgi:hypothetical protein